jgi:hypothetical protein
VNEYVEDEAKNRVKSGGQECPPHTSNSGSRKPRAGSQGLTSEARRPFLLHCLTLFFFRRAVSTQELRQILREG